MRVLLVEDELQLAEQLGRALSQAGYAVDHAADGERGEFLGRTEGYDAVILDLGLPKVDGLTVLKQWREWASMGIRICTRPCLEARRIARSCVLNTAGSARQ